MQKYLLIFSIILSFSCKKEKVDEKEIYFENQLIGKWIYNELKINGILYSYQHNPNCQKDRFYFVNRTFQDHDYTEVLYLYTHCASSITGMDWKLQGRNLILNFGNQLFNYKILRLDHTNLDVSISIDYDRDGKVDDVEIYAIKDPCNVSDDINCQ